MHVFLSIKLPHSIVVKNKEVAFLQVCKTVRRFTASKKEVEQNLTSANLTERGFKKTTLTQRVDVEEGEQLQKIVRFQKSVPCEDMAKVEEELRASLPGAWGKAVSDEVRKEAMAKRGKNQHCTAGIEIHLFAQNCRNSNSKS